MASKFRGRLDRANGGDAVGRTASCRAEEPVPGDGARIKCVRNLTKGAVVADRVRLAESFWARLKGLLASPPLVEGEGLYLVPCRSIHMIGMKYAIDAVFVDAGGVVVGVVERIAPGKISPVFARARGCLELPAGRVAASGTQVGDRLEMVDWQAD